MASDWKLIKDSFHAALELDSAARSEFVDALPPSIADEVRGLLSSHDSLDGFIDTPAPVGLGLGAAALVGTEIGNYRLIELVGAGGMGSVYRAEKKDVGRGFAVKLIKRGMDSDAVLRRFELERRILARLEHPNIARLLDGGTTADGLPYFVMEFVDGIPLTRFCSENKLGLRARLALFRQICDAVSYAHRNLIVHRDLKPSNILVTRDGTPKLLDFGIAKLLDGSADSATPTVTQLRAFTPEYASPEQLRGLPVTTASDVYSLGVVLYELLSGRRPFDAAGAENEMLGQILMAEPLRASVARRAAETSQTAVVTKNDGVGPQERQQIEGDLDNIVLKSIRKEAERRYGSVVEMADDIDRFLGGRPVSATADSRRYRFSKFIARHKRAVLTASLTASLLFVATAVAVRQGVVATNERRKAEKRLTDIRQVAKSLVTETNDSLAKIPGNVAIQKSLAEKSVALLDSLANEESGDVELEGELADAYVKLAAIQNWSFRDFDKAVTNLEKAEAIYSRFLGRSADDAALRRRIYTAQLRHIEALHNTGRREEMLGIGAGAVENLRELVRLDPDLPVNSADLAAMHGWFGDKYVFFGRDADAASSFASGVEYIDQAIEKRQRSLVTADERAELARYFFIKGWLVNGAGNSAAAVDDYRRASLLAVDVFRENPAVAGNLLRAVGGYEGIAGIAEKNGKFAVAYSAYEDALKFLGSAADRRENPEFGEVAYYRCFYSVRLGGVAQKLGRTSDAVRFFDLGERACRESVRQDEADTSRLFENLPYFFDIAAFRASTGETIAARRELGVLAERIQKVLDGNGEDLTAAFSLAQTYEKIGDLDRRDSAEFYRKSAEIWNKYSAVNPLVPEERVSMERVLAKLIK